MIGGDWRVCGKRFMGVCICSCFYRLFMDADVMKSR